MAVSRRLRFEILRRDGMTCRYCGGKAPDVSLTVDHVVPQTLGGGDDPSNLVTACSECNSGKASVAPDSPMVEEVDATAMLMAKALERVAAERQQETAELAILHAQFSDKWNDWHIGDTEERCYRPANWSDSIDVFLANGLTIEELKRYIDTAMNSRAKPSGTWRYLCGCCWNEIGRRQERARQLIEDGEV